MAVEPYGDAMAASLQSSLPVPRQLLVSARSPAQAAAAPISGLFMTTKPGGSKCWTRRSGVIAAVYPTADFDLWVEADAFEAMNGHCWMKPLRIVARARKRTASRCATRNTISGRARGGVYLLIVPAPTKQAASSCELAPPEQPIAPISFPSSINGIPPREAIMSSSVN
jgi:hypothetical protein